MRPASRGCDRASWRRSSPCRRTGWHYPRGHELDLDREGEHRLRAGLGARAYDVFGTADFLDHLPWIAALEYLLAQGIDAIAAHDQERAARIMREHTEQTRRSFHQRRRQAEG
jgi:DNA-binding GntR family transcriptional regulator